MDANSSLIAELNRRIQRYSSPETITLEGVPIERRSLTPPGAVTCLVATQGSPLLGQIRSAAFRNDYNELHQHGTEIAKAFAETSRQRERMFETLSTIPVLTEFRYGDRILAQGMVTTETLSVATVSVHYHGGPLHDAEFHAVDYFYPDIIPEIEHLLLISMPSLTELEKAVLSQLSKDGSQAILSTPGLVAPAEGADERERIIGDGLEDDGPTAENIGAQQRTFCRVDATASAGTLLNLRMKMRKRR